MQLVNYPCDMDHESESNTQIKKILMCMHSHIIGQITV